MMYDVIGDPPLFGAFHCIVTTKPLSVISGAIGATGTFAASTANELDRLL